MKICRSPSLETKWVSLTCFCMPFARSASHHSVINIAEKYFEMNVVISRNIFIETEWYINDINHKKFWFEVYVNVFVIGSIIIENFFGLLIQWSRVWGQSLHTPQLEGYIFKIFYHIWGNLRKKCCQILRELFISSKI